MFLPMLWILLVSALACTPPEAMTGFHVASTRNYQVGDLPVDVEITAVDAAGKAVPFCGAAAVSGLVRGPERTPVTEVGGFVGGKAVLRGVLPAGGPVTVRLDVGGAGGPGGAAGDPGAAAAEPGDAARVLQGTWTPDLRHLPGYLSIIPPLFAIILAVLLRQALLALFAGIWGGALFIHGYDPFEALLRTFDTYLPNTLVDSGHAAIVLFTLALGGMVGIISKSGGTQALVDLIAARAKSRRAGLLTSWVSGLVVFFDDYANCLLVGNTVRPFTDRLRISREKLAYIVDSTAAPVSTVAIVSTWIGYQIGLLDDVFKDSGLSGYDLFLDILPYSFYSFFTLFFVLVLALTQRDFGPMLAAERRAIHDGQVLRPDARPLMDKELTDMRPEDPARAHWSTALVPVISVIVFVIGGLYGSGVRALGDGAADAGIRDIIASADSYAVLLWASFGGSIVALIMALARRAITVADAMDAWLGGAKAMMMAVAILVLAWALGTMCKDYLHTGAWVLSAFQPSPHWIPLMTFLVSSVIALATGSSFSTMAIVIPIAGPMAWALTGADAGVDAGTVDSIRFATLAAVLSGSVFGDHCSPISDTTIMSSMSSASDHIDHVRTQAPYALLCAGASALIGFVPAGFGVSPLISLAVGLTALTLVVRFVGRRAGDPR